MRKGPSVSCLARVALVVVALIGGVAKGDLVEEDESQVHVDGLQDQSGGDGDGWWWWRPSGNVIKKEMQKRGYGLASGGSSLRIMKRGQPGYNYHDSLRVMRRGQGVRIPRDHKMVQDSLRIMKKAYGGRELEGDALRIMKRGGLDDGAGEDEGVSEDVRRYLENLFELYSQEDRANRWLLPKVRRSVVSGSHLRIL